MTRFEFLIVAFSILISMAIARLLEGIVHQARYRSGDWMHSSWLVLVLLNALTLWWVLWELNQATWSFYAFLVLLTGPMLIFAQAAVLIPSDPNTVKDWRAHFFANAKFFFLLRAVAVVQTIIAGHFIAGVLPSRILYVGPVIFVVFVVAAYTQNQRYHLAVLVLSVVMALAAIFVN